MTVPEQDAGLLAACCCFLMTQAKPAYKNVSTDNASMKQWPLVAISLLSSDMIDGSLLIRSFKHSAETRPQTCDDHIRKFASHCKQDAC
jgi:hypothetical protein